MEKQFFLGGIAHKLLEEKGSILPFTAFFLVILVILFAGLVDFGRVMLIRERTQTATDAAALASATSEVKRYVTITVETTDRMHFKTIVNADGKKQNVLVYMTPRNVTRTASGMETDLVDDKGWLEYVADEGADYYDCDYKIDTRWVEYTAQKGTINDAAHQFYAANMPSGTESSQIEQINTYDNVVVVYATSKVKSLFPGLFGIFPDEYSTTTCSQGDTYYKSADSDKWVEPPEDYTWRDW